VFLETTSGLSTPHATILPSAAAAAPA
jgi:hypothetical protein